MLLAQQAEFFDRPERRLAQFTLTVFGHDDFILIVAQRETIKALDSLQVGIYWLILSRTSLRSLSLLTPVNALPLAGGKRVNHA